MASNFWHTSHWRNLVPRECLMDTHVKDRRCGLTDDLILRMKIHVTEYLSDLAKVSQQLIRQRVVATAITFFRRFYLRHCFRDFDPRLVGPACLYLACKSEEAQVQAKVLFHIMRKLSARRPDWPIPEMSQLLELELVLLEVLDYSLVVFSPYRDLVQFLQDPRVACLAEFAWAALNDSYRTDLCLIYPPFLLALAAINMAAAASKQDIQLWLEDLDIDHSKLATATGELISCYQRFKTPMDAADFTRCLEVIGQGHCQLTAARPLSL